MTIAAFHGDLNGMLGDLFDLGALYGDTPDDAFDINTSPAVNTIETIANGELHAILSVKMSPARRARRNRDRQSRADRSARVRRSSRCVKTSGR